MYQKSAGTGLGQIMVRLTVALSIGTRRMAPERKGEVVCNGAG